MSSTVHVDNQRKVILILGIGPTQGLDDTKLTAEAKYPINFTKSNERFVLSLHCSGNHSLLFVNATKTYQSKAKDSGIKTYPLCLDNVSKAFTIGNMKRTGLKESVKSFLLIRDLLMLMIF